MSNCEKLREKHIKCVRLGRSLWNARTDRDLDMENFCEKVLKTTPYIFIQNKNHCNYCKEAYFITRHGTRCIYTKMDLSLL